MLKQAKSPEGYKHLLVYKKAEELLAETLRYTATFPKDKTGIGLADQMDRSARSVKANIVEGWKRNATHEYYTFLGYSIASNAELVEDYLDICHGHYKSKGIQGGKGRNGEEVESLRFYPLDSHLPPSVQLYLRAKELNFLLEKLQASLLERMHEKKTLGVNDRLRLSEEHKKKRDGEYDRMVLAWLEREGNVWTERGIVSKAEAARHGWKARTGGF